MTAQQHLYDNYKVTMAQANDFIMDNLDNLQYIFDICKEYKVDTDMIAQIVSITIPDINGTEVSNYFASKGIDPLSLGGSVATIDVSDVLVVDSLEDDYDDEDEDDDATFPFTQEWLDHRTVYAAVDDDDNGTFESIITYTFENNIMTGVDEDGEVLILDYMINGDGNLVLFRGHSPEPTDFIKGLEEITGLNAIEIGWADDYTYLMGSDEDTLHANHNLEYFFLDQASAEAFIV